MHIFITAYVLLALASWSALAAPQSYRETVRDNEHAQKRSLSSSNLISRQITPGFIGLDLSPVTTDSTSGDSDKSSHDSGKDSGTMDCLGDSSDSNTEAEHKAAAGVNLTTYYNNSTGTTNQNNSTDTTNNNSTDTTNNNTNPGTTGNAGPGPGPNPTTTTDALPTIARRRFRNSMRRRADKASKESKSSIFERENHSSRTSTADKPITIDDIVANYLKQRAASRRRAYGDMRPRTSRGAK